MLYEVITDAEQADALAGREQRREQRADEALHFRRFGERRGRGVGTGDLVKVGVLDLERGGARVKFEAAAVSANLV